MSGQFVKPKNTRFQWPPKLARENGSLFWSSNENSAKPIGVGNTVAVCVVGIGAVTQKDSQVPARMAITAMLAKSCFRESMFEMLRQ